MPAARYIPPINTLDQKLQIQRRLGGLKSCKYFNLLTMYLSMKVTKPDFDRLCIALIGRENVPLHNHFLKSILKKACLSKAAPPRQNIVEGSLNAKIPNGCNGIPPKHNIAEGSLKVKIPNGCNGIPPLGKNSRKCRTPNLRDRRFRGPLSPLGPHGKNGSIGFENSTPKIQEHQMDVDVHPVGNSLHVSVEHREEVNPDSERLAINRRSPIRSPLGRKNNVIGFENSTPKSQEHQMDTHLHPVGNRFYESVEHREEVNRDSERLAINRRPPIPAPLGPHVMNNSTVFENSTPKFQEHQRDTDLHRVRDVCIVSMGHRKEVIQDQGSAMLAMNRRSPMRAPLGPRVMNSSIGFENSTPKVQEHQMDTDLNHVRNSFHVSVEHSKEVIQDSAMLAMNRRTPVRAPLGPHMMNNSTGFENSTPKVQEHQMDADLHHVGNGFYVPVEHRKEVIQDSAMLAMNRRTPVQAPLGPHVMNNSTVFENSTPKFQEHKMDADLHHVGNGVYVPVEHRKEVIPDSAMLAMNKRTPMRAPIGPHVMNNSTGFGNSTPKFQEQQMDTDLHHVRDGILVPMEHRKEVIQDQDSVMLAINRRTPMRAPLGPHVMNNSTGFDNSTPKFQEHQINTVLHPVRNGFHLSEEHGKEVIPNSAMLTMNRAPIRAPLGLPTYDNRGQIFTHEGLQSGIVTDTCQSIGHLPDTYSLMKRMECNLETEGCNISADAANVLNTALDVYLKRLIKPSLDIASSINNFSSQIQPGVNKLPQNRCVQKPIGSATASISDFRTAMELNPTILGEDWPLQLEKTCFLAFEK